MPTNSSQRATGSVRRRMAVGIGWTVAARWTVRGIGFVGMILLARLLSPADFGLVAMGMLTVAFVGIFAEAGQDLAIIRHADPTPEHFDTAWTMSVCVGLLMALILLAIAPFAGWYFHDPRAVPLTRFLALVPLLDGFTNVGVVAGFRRDLSFDREFYFIVVRKLSGYVVAVPLALILRDYWALAIGIVLGRLITVLASYRMHPYRPRLRLTKLGELWSFSAWSLIAAIALYSCGEADQIVVGGLMGTAAMGIYVVARNLAWSPTYEVVVPAARALFPVYATLLDDPVQLVQSYLEVLSFVAIIAFATGVGVAFVSEDLVVMVLGSNWSMAAGLVPWLAIGAGVLGIASSVNNILNVTGNARLSAVRNWMFLAVLAPATILCGLQWGSAGVAVAWMAVAILFVPVMFYSLMRVVPITTTQIMGRLWRPALAALSMAAVLPLSGTAEIPVVGMRLFCNVGLGAAVFGVVLLALWFLAGRPAGAERVVIAQTRAALGRLASVTAGRAGRGRGRRMADELSRFDSGSS
jgi:O-antigen/teichoic acid export membrane protein